MSTEKSGPQVSSLSRRVAANWLKERGLRVALDEMPADGGGGEQTALPKSGPMNMVLKKNIQNLTSKLEANDHEGFKSALDDLNSNFSKLDANYQSSGGKYGSSRR